MKRFPALLVVMLMTVGAGCIEYSSNLDTTLPPAAPPPPAIAPPTPTPAPSPEPSPTPVPPPAASADPYDGWGTLTPGGVITMRIPPGCHGDPGAGNIYVVCPTPGNDTPTPDMHISSDGMQVNIRRWEDHAWDQWDMVVNSIKVLTPLDRDIQINIQH